MSLKSDYLRSPAGAPIIGVWVQLKRNSDGAVFTSTLKTASPDGLFFHSAPGDLYTVYTSPDGVTYTATTNTSYPVPYVAGDDIAVRSETTLASGPYTAIAAPGETVTSLNPANIKAYGASTASADNQTAINNAIIAANAAGGGEVYIPPGTWITSTITLLSGVVLRGSRDGSILKLKNSTNGDLITAAVGVHSGTAIRDLMLDGNGANQTTGNIITAANAGTTLGDFTVIGNTLLNAAIHGMYLSEGTPATPIVRKVIRDNVVNDHGLAGVGYGIYVDWAAPAIIQGNWVFSHNANDNIELGHTSHGDGNYSYQCIGNVCIGGQLQFPFANGAQIIGNLVINSNIQNDTNTANDVVIEGNRVVNAPVANGYSGINVTGARAIIKGNRVQITGLAGANGVGCNAQAAFSDSLIEGNIVETLAAAPTGVAIACGTAASSSGNQIIGNTVFGQWLRGISVTGPSNSVRGNTLDLTAAIATTGIYLVPSSTSGVLAANCDIIGNRILGTPTTAIDYVGVANNILGTLVRDNIGFNPLGATFQPPIVTTLVSNRTGVDCAIYITTSGANNVPTIQINGVTTGQVVPINSTGIYIGIVHSRGTIQLPGATLTGTSWVWVGVS